MKITATARITKVLEIEVDDKFHQIDGWHPIDDDVALEMRDELESIIIDEFKDCFDVMFSDDIEVACVEESDSGEYLIEN